MQKEPNLLLHCGGERVERKDLKLYPAPAATPTYTPVTHQFLLDLVEEKMSDYGFEFGLQSHGLAADGKRYFGTINLLHDSVGNDQHALILGLRNSYDKSVSAGLALGSCVFVCDNLAFTSDIVFKRRHTRHILRDLPEIVRKAVSKTELVAEVQERRFDHYRRRSIESDAFAHNLITQMYRNGCVQANRLGRVIDEWHEPSHDHGPRTVWRLFNAATEALKGTPAHDMPRRTIGVQQICDEASEFDDSQLTLAA